MNGPMAKKILREAFDHVLNETDPRRSFSKIEEVLDRIRDHSRLREGSVFIVAIGKIALPMSDELIERCRLESPKGVVTMPHLKSKKRHDLRIFTGGHPYPNEDSLTSARHALRLLTNAGENELAVFLLSGGGSASFEIPLKKGVSLQDMKSFHRTLVGCGANIIEMNTVRKHLSGVKGGRLAVAAAPARQITIMISNVPKGSESSIASGPTMPDESILEEMYDVIERYDLLPLFPVSIGRFIRSRAIPETPKEDDPAFRNAEFHCLLSNEDVLDEAKKFAEKRGWVCSIDTTADDMRVDDACDYLLRKLNLLKSRNRNRPVCIIAGGEVRSPVKGDGLGGRNQAFALECATRIQSQPIAVLSGGTDGIDGNSPAAGGLVDGDTVDHAESSGMDTGDFRDRSDSHSLLNSLGDDIKTGPTGNNLCDLRMLVKW